MTPLFTFTPHAVHADIPRPARASFSSLDSWLQCPGRWAAGRLLTPPRDWGSPLVLGGIVHAALEIAMRDPNVNRPDWRRLTREGIRLEQGKRDAQGWGDDPAPRVVKPDGVVATPDDWADAAAVKLHGFHLTMALGRTPTPAAMEQHVEGTVWGIPLHGFIDYRDKDGTLVDWKTGRIPKNGVRHADQLRVYTRLADLMGVHVSGARDVYVEHDAHMDADLTAPAMADTGTRLAHAWEGMSSISGDGSGDYPLTPSFLCAWCPLAAACPAFTPTAPIQREAMRTSLDEHDPRVAYTGTHTLDGKEQHMTSDILDLLGGGAPTPTPTPAPASTGASPERGSDPWATPAGKAAFAAWGLDQPATPATPTPAKRKLVAGEGRPYEPSLTNGRLNMAGYGFSQLTLMAAWAADTAGRSHDARTLLDRLLAVEWDVARRVYGQGANDVPGLDDGHPDPQALLAWLDTALSRDVDRAVRMIADHDPTLRDDPLAAVTTAAATTEQALRITRDIIERTNP